MTENELANVYLKTLNLWLDKSIDPYIFSEDEVWELSKTLAKLAQPRKSYAKMYNSSKGRLEREKLANKK